MKHQLMWAKINKEYRQQQSNPGFRQQKVVRTRYRRAWDEEEIEENAEERQDLPLRRQYRCELQATASFL
jgi:hypothetical protein